jgi:hypothetical protein
MIYGVDFLTTNKMRDRFASSYNKIHQIRFINDSTCRLVFKTEEEARCLLTEQLKEPKDIDLKNDNGDETQYKGWYTLK